MKITLSTILLLFILAACTAPVVTTDIIVDNNDAASENRTESLPVAAENEEQSMDELIAYLTETSALSIRQRWGDYLFFYYSGQYNDNPILSVRMIRRQFVHSGTRQHNFDTSIELRNTDSLFRRAISEGADLELSFDFIRFSATLVVQKHTYNLDFTAGTYTHVIEYRIQDLDLDSPVDTSPDGRLQLHTTYLDGGGEAQWGDYVVLDIETQEIWYISDFVLFDQAVFTGTDRILFIQGRGYNIKLLNAFTGESLPGAPEFDFDEHFVVGVTFDSIKNRILIAYRERYYEGAAGWEPTHTIYVDVFDVDGVLINTIDTGFVMQPRIASFHNIVFFEAVENGVAVLSTLTTLNSYMERVELGSFSY